MPVDAIAFYDFEGEGSIADRTGNGHDGSLVGPTAARGVGKFCSGLHTQDDDAVVVPDSPAFDFVDGYTLEMWIHLPDPQSSPRADKGSTFTLRASHRGLSYVAHEPCFSSGGTYPMGFDTTGWHHVAGSWDGLQWHYFVDAVEVWSLECESPPVLNDLPLRLGQGVGPSDIDDVALFDHARTLEQICGDARGSWQGSRCALP